MNIIWYGETCFRINTQKNRNSQVSILIDPPSKESGLRSPKLEADILLFTNPEKEKTVASSETGERFLITSPGEYDIKEVYIQGIALSKNIIYTIETEEMKICHLGQLNQKELTSNQLERIGAVDILMIPIGGGQTFSAKEAIKTMAQIEPKIIIPMYYQIPKLKTKLDTLGRFLKALGVKSLPSLPKLSVKKKDLLSEEVKIIVLEP